MCRSRNCRVNEQIQKRDSKFFFLTSAALHSVTRVFTFVSDTSALKRPQAVPPRARRGPTTRAFHPSSAPEAIREPLYSSSIEFCGRGLRLGVARVKPSTTGIPVSDRKLCTGPTFSGGRLVGGSNVSRGQLSALKHTGLLPFTAAAATPVSPTLNQTRALRTATSPSLSEPGGAWWARGALLAAPVPPSDAPTVQVQSTRSRRAGKCDALVREAWPV